MFGICVVTLFPLIGVVIVYSPLCHSLQNSLIKAAAGTFRGHKKAVGEPRWLSLLGLCVHVAHFEKLHLQLRREYMFDRVTGLLLIFPTCLLHIVEVSSSLGESSQTSINRRGNVFVSSSPPETSCCPSWETWSTLKNGQTGDSGADTTHVVLSEKLMTYCHPHIIVEFIFLHSITKWYQRWNEVLLILCVSLENNFSPKI